MNQDRIALLVRSYNRPHYLRETLSSLLKSDIDICVHRYIFDDCSSDPEVHAILSDLSLVSVPGKAFTIIKGSINVGCRASYLKALQSITKDCDYICTLDNDVLVKENLITALLQVYEDAFSIFNTHNMLVTGFNPTNAHKTCTSTFETFYRKTTCGAVNYFFHASFQKFVYRHWKKHLDWGVCSSMKKSAYPLICSNTSVVQHIGKTGLWSSDVDWDHDEQFDYHGH